MQITHKNIGIMLVGIAVLIIVLLTFIKMDNDTKSAALCSKFEQENLDMSNCPAHKSNFSWIIIIAYAVGFLLLLLGMYFIFFDHKPLQELKKEFKNIDLAKLDEDEKLLYDKVKSKNGIAYQADLIKETGFSKVKITRVLDKMESKDILERKRRGMTNLIVLK